MVIDKYSPHDSESGWYEYINNVNAPNFRLNKLRNSAGSLNLADLEGEVVILSFIPGLWAPWARKFLSHLETNLNNKKYDLNFRFITIVSQARSNLEVYKDWLPEHSELLADPHGVVSMRYGIFNQLVQEPLKFSRPVVFLIDGEQRLRFKFFSRYLVDWPNLNEMMSLISLIQHTPLHKKMIKAVRSLVNV